MERIVLAYSGGLDTSVAIPWLAEKYGAEIVAVTLDLGQGRELDGHPRARAGARRGPGARDRRARGVRARLHPAGAAGRRASTRTGIRWPRRSAGRSIAKQLVEIARMEGATAIAHGCTGKGNDQVRLDVSARALDPTIR